MIKARQGSGSGAAPGRSAPPQQGWVTARRPARLAAALAASVVVLGFLLVGVFPTRDWWAQRDERSHKKAELTSIGVDQRRLERRLALLETPEEVEHIAREEYGLSRPGETPFRLLPDPVAPVDLPERWPFTGTADWLNR